MIPRQSGHYALQPFYLVFIIFKEFRSHHNSSNEFFYAVPKKEQVGAWKKKDKPIEYFQ